MQNIVAHLCFYIPVTWPEFCVKRVSAVRPDVSNDVTLHDGSGSLSGTKGRTLGTIRKY